MVVTKIEPVTKTKYKIFVDEQFAFVLYKGELSRYHLKENDALTEDLFHKIKTEVILKRARLRAMHLLNDMARTESGLREKLRQGLYTEDIIEQAVRYVKSFGYVDDYKYAQNFIESRKESKSKKEIYAMLCSKGIAREEIDMAFEECYNTQSERAAIAQVLRKKRFDNWSGDEEKTRKIYGYLARKGFQYEDIRQVVQNYDKNA